MCQAGRGWHHDQCERRGSIQPGGHPGRLRGHIRFVLSDGDTVAVVWDGHGVANDGQPYDNSYVWVMRMAAGKVIDGIAFFDSISFNGLWQRVEPR